MFDSSEDGGPQKFNGGDLKYCRQYLTKLKARNVIPLFFTSRMPLFGELDGVNNIKEFLGKIFEGMIFLANIEGKGSAFATLVALIKQQCPEFRVEESMLFDDDPEQCDLATKKQMHVFHVLECETASSYDEFCSTKIIKALERVFPQGSAEPSSSWREILMMPVAQLQTPPSVPSAAPAASTITVSALPPEKNSKHPHVDDSVKLFSTALVATANGTSSLVEKHGNTRPNSCRIL